MPTWKRTYFYVVLFGYILLSVQASNYSKKVNRGAEEDSWQTWGPYRPNLYFGVRPQIPETFLMGLMWASGESRNEMLETLRDTCEQDDGMQGYGWTSYDTRVGGSQIIHDKELHIDLKTDFLKSKSGDSWAVRITGTPRADAPSNVKTTVILHTAIEQAGQDNAKSLVCTNQRREHRVRNGVEPTCRGEIPALGSFELYVTEDARNNVVHDAIIKSLKVPEDKIWQAKSVFADQVRIVIGSKVDNLVLDNEPGAGNMHFIQSTFEGAFMLTFTYRELGAVLLEPDSMETEINAFHSSFSTNVDKAFPRTGPFEHEKYSKFSRFLLSNLLGGLGFFYGDSKVDYSHSPEYEETDLDFWEKSAAAMSRAPITTTSPTSLLSHTPSRPFFPRGFLWDEGFHLLPVVEWDLDLAVSVLRSWLNLMDEDGWIAREQILGPEARSKVPEKFQTQYPHYANPPTLSLLFPMLISKLTNASTYDGHPSVYVSSGDRASTMLRELYPLLSRHYRWFCRTQAGDFSGAYPRPDDVIAGVGYRWRGRTPMHTLTSGLDDYPRGNPPHPAELHVDALAWVGASADALQQVAEYLGEDADADIYRKHLVQVKHNLEKLHWDTAEQIYCDATVADRSYVRVCHQGYVSLFPLLLGLIDAEHPNLPSILDLLSDPEKIWSKSGLRSLSAADPNYGKNEDYWRGAVWMNVNVLAVLRLQKLGTQDRDRSNKPTPIQKRMLFIAAELRERVINTVYRSWETTGFVWEQYKDGTGEGTHSRAFTGWTACVVLLMGLNITKDSGNRQGGHGFSFQTLNWTVTSMASFVLIMALRRRLMALAVYIAKYWHNWTDNWSARQRYEQVIDLEEREA